MAHMFPICSSPPDTVQRSFEPKGLPGGYSTREVFPGVNLIQLSLGAGQPFSTGFSKPADTFEFGFILHGHACSFFEDSAAGPLALGAESMILHYLPEIPVRFEVAPGPRTQMLGIEISLSVLQELVRAEPGISPGILRSLESGSKTPFLRSGKMRAMQKTVVSQLFSSPFQGTAGNLYRQAKVLELISLQIHMLTRADYPGPDLHMSRGDEERIRHARSLLRENMVEAPTLVELSRQVGLNLSKLKKGFKAVYGKTAFACLHADRMDRAHSLLSRRRLNVSQVAWEVGYINVGHFSAAFKKQFGVCPKTFQMDAGDRARCRSAIWQKGCTTT